MNSNTNKVRILTDITRQRDKKPVTYDVVMVISQHDNVLICEGKERFSVNVDKTEPCQ